MQDKIRDKYLDYGIMQYFMNAGSGVVKAHNVLIHTNGYNSTDYDNENGAYVYAIEMYTDGATFDVLQEDGKSVSAQRINAGGSGYPKQSIITGKFNKITPAEDVIVGVWIKKSN